MSNLDQLAQQQKALGDPTRLRILRLLHERPLCVCEIEAVLQIPQYAVSRHLGILRHAGLAQSWRKGTWMYYQLAADLPAAWEKALTALCQLWDTDKQIKTDLRRLQQSQSPPCG